MKRQGRRRPWDGRPGAFGSCSLGDGDSTTPSPGGGPGGKFLFCSATGPRDPVSTFPSPSLFASGQQGPVRGRDAFSRAPCPAVEPGECLTTHSDPTSRRTAFRVGPLGSTALPHRGYVYVSPGPACTVPGGPCLDPPSIPLCVRRTSIPVGPPLRAPQPVGASSQAGKEHTLPYAEDLFSRHGVGLGQPHSTSLRGACSVNAEMPGVSPAQEGGSTETFQRLLGHMASSDAITPLGLLHMRQLQRWLHDRVPRWAWRHGTYRVSLTPSCRRTFSPWLDLAFLRAGVPLEQVSRHVVVSTDASATGWGAMCNGHAAAGLWTGTLGTDALACSWPRGLCKYAFPPVSLLAQTLCKVRGTRSKSSWWRLTGPISSQN